MSQAKRIPKPVVLAKISTLALAVLLLLCGGLLYTSYAVLTKELQKHEKKEVEDLVQRSRNALEIREKTLLSLGSEIARSRALHAIIAANKDKIDALGADWIGLKEKADYDLFDFILFFNKEGTLLHEDAVAIVTEQGLRNAQTTLNQVKELADGMNRMLAGNQSNSAAGLFLPGSGVPVLLAAAGIPTKTGNDQTEGLLILGRYLDHALLRAINAENGLTLRFSPVGGAQTLVEPEAIKNFFSQNKVGVFVSAVDEHTNAGYAIATDIFGQPSLTLEIVRNRTTYQHGMALWRRVAAMVSAALFAVPVLLLALLYPVVFRRLRQLTLDIDALAAVGHAGSRVQIKGNDEITLLAGRINSLLATLEHCQRLQYLNEHSLSQALDSIHCGVIIIDAATCTITDINAKGAAMLGLLPKEIRGKVCHQFLCPAEHHACPVLDIGESVDLSERVLLRADGSRLPVLKSVTAVEMDDKRFLIESFVDISQLKKTEDDLKGSEAKFRRFFEENLAGCCIWTADNAILACNPAFAHLLGYNTVEQVKEAGMREHCYTINQREELLALCAENETIERLECTLRHRNGQPVYCVANIFSQRDPQGVITELRGYFFDDTRRILLERQKHQLGKMDALGSLASGLAHDINNIIASIKGNAELLSSTATGFSPQEKRALNDITRASERAQGLTTQVLTFSRPLEKPAQPVCFSDMLNETLQILRVTLPENVRLDAQIHTQGLVVASESELHQVIMNLCVNAVQAMQPQGGVLKIALDEVDLLEPDVPDPACQTHGTALRLCIEDTGCGMPPEQVEHIFDPFYSTKPKGIGTGLGLWLVQKHVASMQGRIAVQSRLGEGSIFTLLCPLYKEWELSPSLKNTSLPRGNERIFLGDGNPFVLEVCTAMLQQLGYTVRAFADAHALLAALEGNSNATDLLIVDHDLPPTGGAELVRQWRASGHRCPVLLSHESSSPLLDNADCPIDGCLQKPVNMEELAKIIRLTLDCSRTIRDTTA